MLNNEVKWISESIETIKEVLTGKNNNYDLLAILEFENCDIELTFRDNQNGVVYYDYYACKKVDMEWESWDFVDFGDKLPIDFDTLDELKNDMKSQLEKFIQKTIK